MCKFNGESYFRNEVMGIESTYDEKSSNHRRTIEHLPQRNAMQRNATQRNAFSMNALMIEK